METDPYEVYPDIAQIEGTLRRPTSVALLDSSAVHNGGFARRITLP